MKKTYTTVFLDFDDTLIDTLAYSKQCLEEIYTEHEVNKYFPSFDEFFNSWHKHTSVLWEKYALGEIDKQTILKGRFNKPFEAFDTATREYIDNMNQDFLKKVVKNNIYIEGAKTLLEYLKPKYKVVMLSNGFSEMQYDKIKNVGFDGLFDHVILSDAVGVNKPHPDIFTFALKTSDSTAENTIMIGDNLVADIGGAMKSNIDQIWYNPHKQEATISPTYTVDKLEDILKLI